jgi:hypothetical protein
MCIHIVDHVYAGLRLGLDLSQHNDTVSQGLGFYGRSLFCLCESLLTSIA